MKFFQRGVCLPLFLGLAVLGVTAAPNRAQKAQVTFRDVTGDCVMSDGNLGVDNSVAYVDGVEGASASYDRDGNFDLKLKEIWPVEIYRRLFYDFSLPAPSGMDGSASQTHVAPYNPSGMPFLSNVHATVNVPGGLEGMAVGTTTNASVTLQMYLTCLHDQELVRFDHQMYPGTADVTVTRTTATTWTFEASATDVALLLQIPQTRGGNPVDCGYYYMPLSFTVERL
jgi:hypothetical protein